MHFLIFTINESFKLFCQLFQLIHRLAHLLVLCPYSLNAMRHDTTNLFHLIKCDVIFRLLILKALCVRPALASLVPNSIGSLNIKIRRVQSRFLWSNFERVWVTSIEGGIDSLVRQALLAGPFSIYFLAPCR